MKLIALANISVSGADIDEGKEFDVPEPEIAAWLISQGRAKRATEDPPAPAPATEDPPADKPAKKGK